MRVLYIRGCLQLCGRKQHEKTRTRLLNAVMSTTTGWRTQHFTSQSVTRGVQDTHEDT